MTNDEAVEVRRIAEEYGAEIGYDNVCVLHEEEPEALREHEGSPVTGYWVKALLWVPASAVHWEPTATENALTSIRTVKPLQTWLVAELLKLDGKCLDEMTDVQSVAEAIARALEAREQKKET